MACVALPLTPWEIPANVTIKNDNKNAASVITMRLTELDVHTLSAMCEEFREGVFKAAGKADPRVTTR